MLEDVAGGRLRSGADHDEHSLLRLGQHHLVGAHAVLAPAHPVDLQVDAAPTTVGQLAGGAGKPGRTQILGRRHPLEFVEHQAGLTEKLLEKGVAHLDGRPTRCGALVHLDRGEGCSLNAIAAGVGADQQDDITGTVRSGSAQPLMRDQSDAHRVDDRVIGIRGVEVHLAADRRAAKTIPVAADAGHHPLKKVTVPIAVERAEAKHIEDRDRACAHGKDVAQDSPDAGRGTLVRLDRRGVIV